MKMKMVGETYKIIREMVQKIIRRLDETERKSRTTKNYEKIVNYMELLRKNKKSIPDYIIQYKN